MKKEKIFWGLFFILGAIYLVASKLGFDSGISAFSLFMTILFIACLIKSVKELSISGILFSIAFLCIIYAEPLGITAITPWTVLSAALLGSIGCTIIFGNHARRHHDWDRAQSDSNEYIETVDEVEESHLEFATSFGASVKYINSDNFTKGRIDCKFGAMTLYFDNAIIQNEKAVLSINSSFAGVELYIPKSWTVVNKAHVSFGAIEEKNRNQSTGIPELVLVGDVSFSGVEITYV